MRGTVLTLSLTLALCGLCAGVARADDEYQFSLAQYAVPADPYAQDGAAAEFTDVADDPVSTVVTPQHWFDTPDYGAYFQADALWLARAHSVDRPIVVTLPPFSTTVLSSQDADLSNRFSLGGMFTLGFNLDKVAQVEATYFGLNHWSSRAQAIDPAGNLGLAGPVLNATTDFIFSDRMTLDYSSRIHNAEVNYKQTIEGMTLLAGFRYFSLNEDFNINSHGFLSGTTSDYNVQAVNRLIGLQAGWGYGRQWGRLNAGILGKFGVFANVAHQKTLFRDQGNALTLTNYRTETTPVSVLGEVALNTSYQVFDWMLVRFGYRFIGLNNVAMAPGQLNFNNFMPVIDAHEFLLLHGLNAGVEIRW